MDSVSDANDEPISEPSVTWSCSDEAVVTLDEDGLVTAKGNGMTETVSADGEVSDMVSV